MFDKYVVEDNDTLKSIALKFNTSVEELMDINNIFIISELKPGMEIIIPNNNSYYDTYVIEKGDNLYAISKKYNINPTLLASLNGLNMDDYIYPGQEIMIPKNGYSYYITAEGDTLDTVSDLFNISKKDLLNQNKTIYLLKDQILISKRNKSN